MSDCSRCGECCRWFVVSQKRGLTPWQLAYLRERCDRETDQYFLLDSPCKHLFHHLIGSVVNGERVREEYSTCDIYESRPQVCKDYKGKRYTNGQMYYIPESCNMSAENKDEKTKGKTE